MFNTNCYGNESIPSYTQGVETPWPSHTTHSNQNIFHQHAVASNPNAFVGYGLGQVQSKELDLAGVVGMKETAGASSTPTATNAWHHSHRMRYSSTAAASRGFLPYQMSSLPHYDSQPVDTSHLTHGTHHQFWMANPNAYSFMPNYNQRDHNTYAERTDTSRGAGAIRHNTTMPNRNYAVEDQSRNVNTTLQQQPAEVLPQHCQRPSRQTTHQLQQHQQMHHQQEYLRNQLTQRERDPCQYSNSSYHQESMRVGVDTTLYHNQHVMPSTQHQHPQYQASQEALRKAETERRAAFTSRQAWPQTWAKAPYVPFDASQAFLPNRRSSGSAFQPCNKQAGTDPYSMDSIWAKSAVPTPSNHVAHATNHAIPPTNNHIPLPAQSWLHDTTPHLKTNVYRPPQEINQVPNVPSNYPTNVLNLDTGQVELSMSVVPPDLSLFSQTQRHRTSTTHPTSMPVQPRPLPTPAVPQNHLKSVVKDAPPKPVESARPTATARAAGLDVRQFLATWDEDLDIATPRPAAVEIDEPEPAEPPATSLVVLDYQNVPSEELLQLYPGLQLSGNDSVVLIDNTSTKNNLDFVLSRAVTTTTSSEAVSATASDVIVSQSSSAIDVVQSPAAGYAPATSSVAPNGNHFEVSPCTASKSTNVGEDQVDQPLSHESTTPISVCGSDSERQKKTSLRLFRKRKAVSAESDASSPCSELTEECPAKNMKFDNSLSNWLDAIDGPIRTPVSVSSAAAESPVEAMSASEERSADVSTVPESTAVSVITMNRHARDGMGRSMPDIFDDGMYETDQAPSKSVETEHRDTSNVPRALDSTEEVANLMKSEFCDGGVRESEEKSRNRQDVDEDRSPCDVYQESFDRVKQKSPHETEEKSPIAELKSNEVNQQLSELSGEEHCTNHLQASVKTDLETIFVDQEFTRIINRGIVDRLHNERNVYEKREACEESHTHKDPSAEIKPCTNWYTEANDPIDREHFDGRNNSVTILNASEQNPREYTHRELSDQINQVTNVLDDQNVSNIRNPKSIHPMTEQTSVIPVVEPCDNESRENANQKSAVFHKDPDQIANKHQDDSNDFVSYGSQNSNLRNLSIEDRGDIVNREPVDFTCRNSGDFSSQDTSNITSQEANGVTGREPSDLANREGCDSTIQELHDDIIMRESGDFLSREIRDSSNRETSVLCCQEASDLSSRDRTDFMIQDSFDFPSQEHSDFLSRGPSNFTRQSSVDSTSREPRDVTTQSPVDLMSREPRDVTTPSPIDYASREPRDVTTLSPVDFTSREPSVLTSREPSDLTSREPSDLARREPSDLANREPSDLASREPSDLASREPSDLASREPSDLASREPSDLASRESSDLASRESSDLASREPSDSEIPEPSDLEIREPRDLEIREPSDLDFREPRDSEIREPRDLEIGEPRDSETGEPRDSEIREPSDLEIRESSDLASREPSDLASREPSDLASREPSDLASRETSDLASRETSFLASWETSDLASRETSDLASRYPSDLTIEDHGDMSCRNINDFVSREPSDFKTQTPVDSTSRDSSVVTRQSPSNSKSREPSDVSRQSPRDFTSQEPGTLTNLETSDLPSPEPSDCSRQEHDDLSSGDPNDCANGKPSDFMTRQPCEVTIKSPIHFTNGKPSDLTRQSPFVITSQGPGHFLDWDPIDNYNHVPVDSPNQEPSEYYCVAPSESDNRKLSASEKWEPSDISSEEPSELVNRDDSYSASSDLVDKMHTNSSMDTDVGLLQAYIVGAPSKTTVQEIQSSSPKANTELSDEPCPNLSNAGKRGSKEGVAPISASASRKTESEGTQKTAKYLSRIVGSAPGKIPKILLSRLKNVRDKTRRNGVVRKLPSIRLTRVQSSSSQSENEPPEYVCRERKCSPTNRDYREDLSVPLIEKIRKSKVRRIDSPWDSEPESLSKRESRTESRSNTSSPIPEKSPLDFEVESSSRKESLIHRSKSTSPTREKGPFDSGVESFSWQESRTESRSKSSSPIPEKSPLDSKVESLSRQESRAKSKCSSPIPEKSSYIDEFNETVPESPAKFPSPENQSPIGLIENEVQDTSLRNDGFSSPCNSLTTKILSSAATYSPELSCLDLTVHEVNESSDKDTIPRPVTPVSPFEKKMFLGKMFRNKSPDAADFPKQDFHRVLPVRRRIHRRRFSLPSPKSFEDDTTFESPQRSQDCVVDVSTNSLKFTLQPVRLRSVSADAVEDSKINEVRDKTEDDDHRKSIKADSEIVQEDREKMSWSWEEDSCDMIVPETKISPNIFKEIGKFDSDYALAIRSSNDSLKTCRPKQVAAKRDLDRSSVCSSLKTRKDSPAEFDSPLKNSSNERSSSSSDEGDSSDSSDKSSVFSSETSKRSTSSESDSSYSDLSSDESSDDGDTDSAKEQDTVGARKDEWKSIGKEESKNKIKVDIVLPADELVPQEDAVQDSLAHENEVQEKGYDMAEPFGAAERVMPCDRQQSVIDDVHTDGSSGGPVLEKTEITATNEISDYSAIEHLARIYAEEHEKLDPPVVADSSNCETSTKNPAAAEIVTTENSSSVPEREDSAVLQCVSREDDTCPVLDPVDSVKPLSSPESTEMPCLDRVVEPDDTNDYIEKTDSPKFISRIDAIDGTEVLVHEETLLVFTDDADTVFVEGEDSCVRVDVDENAKELSMGVEDEKSGETHEEAQDTGGFHVEDDDENVGEFHVEVEHENVEDFHADIENEKPEEYHIVVNEEQYKGLYNGTMEVFTADAMKTFTVETVKKEELRTCEEVVNRDRGDYYCDEINSAPVEEVVNSGTACDIVERGVCSAWLGGGTEDVDVVLVPLESIQKGSHVEKVLSGKEEAQLSCNEVRLEMKCSLSWDRILNEGQGLVLGPANVEVRVPGEVAKENTHWKVVTRERKRPGSSKASFEENNNVMPDVKSPIVVVKRLVLKRPKTRRPQRKREEHDALGTLWKDVTDKLPPLKTKAALKAFQAQTEVTHLRNRNRSWPSASGNTTWKRRSLKRRRSDFSPPSRKRSCPSPHRLPKVIIKKTGPKYQSFICDNDVFMQPVVSIERNAELDNLALTLWSKGTSPASSGGQSPQTDSSNQTKDKKIGNAGPVNRRRRKQPKTGRAGQLMKVVELLQQWRQAEHEAASKVSQDSLPSDCEDPIENNNSFLCIDNHADDSRYLHRFHTSDTDSSSSREDSCMNDFSYDGNATKNINVESSSKPESENDDVVEDNVVEDELVDTFEQKDVPVDNIKQQDVPGDNGEQYNVHEDNTKESIAKEDNIVETTVTEDNKGENGINFEEDIVEESDVEDYIEEENVPGENVEEENILEENVGENCVRDSIVEGSVVRDNVDVVVEEDLEESSVESFVQNESLMQQAVQVTPDVIAQEDDITEDAFLNENIVEEVEDNESVTQEVAADNAIQEHVVQVDMSQNGLVEKIVEDIVQEYDNIGKVGISTLQEADSVSQDSTLQEADSAFEAAVVQGTASALHEVVVREADSALQEDVYLHNNQQDVEVSCTEKDILEGNAVSPEQSRRTSIEEDLGLPLICQVCGFTTTRLEEQANHIRTHSYHCQRCQLAFSSHEDFKDHMVAEHPTIEELHHCLLCQRTFPTAERHAQHKKGWHHCQMERSQRHTIHSLYRFFTGNDCPYLPSLAPEEVKAFDWLPSDPGVIHFYHDATPLQLAVQDCGGAKDDTGTC